MAGFADILGSLVQNGLSQSSGTRITNAFGGQQGGLGDILGNLGQMLGSGQSQSGQGIDLGSMMGSVLGSLGGQQEGGTTGGLGGMLGDMVNNLGHNKAAIGGLGALAGALLGKQGGTRGAIGGGALAVLASVAMSALKNAGQQAHQTPAAFHENPTPEQLAQLDTEAEIIVKAMISAAKADGQIDQNEVERIIGKLDDDGLSEEDKIFFQQEAQAPLDLNAVIASAGGRPEIAAQIYAASLLAVEVDTQEEEQYMQQLAAGLGLSDETVQFIEQSLTK